MAKKKTQSKSFVRRPLYQSLMERYKKLSADMKIITQEGFSVEKIDLVIKYREQYKRGDQFLREMINQLKLNSAVKKKK